MQSDPLDPPDPLDAVFQNLAATSPPKGDATAFRQAVWREIRHRRPMTETAETAMPDCVELLGALFPRLALFGATIAVAIGVLTGTLQIPPEENTASLALDLNVFQPDTQDLPHANLLVKR